MASPPPGATSVGGCLGAGGLEGVEADVDVLLPPPPPPQALSKTAAASATAVARRTTTEIARGPASAPHVERVGTPRPRRPLRPPQRGRTSRSRTRRPRWGC